MRRPTIREALAAELPLVTPLAHDALSARLIEQAGFHAFAIGGSALLAARHAYPDIGLIGLTDMVDGIRDIAAASSLPFIADADDGYEIGRAHVRTPVTNAHLVCRLLLEKKNIIQAHKITRHHTIQY